MRGCGRARLISVGKRRIRRLAAHATVQGLGWTGFVTLLLSRADPVTAVAPLWLRFSAVFGGVAMLPGIPPVPGMSGAIFPIVFAPVLPLC